MYLHYKAPFGVQRTLRQTYRQTLPVLTPSAAYGLLLNIAAIEMRGKRPADLPPLEIACGVIGAPAKFSLLQHAHIYPVDAKTGKGRIEETKGTKYWITPRNHEYLWQVEGVIAVRGDLCDRIRLGLNGQLERYGLPFYGQNDFFFSTLLEVSEIPFSQWYVPDKGHGSHKVTTWADHADFTSSSEISWKTNGYSTTIPEQAWLFLPPIKETLN